MTASPRRATRAHLCLGVAAILLSACDGIIDSLEADHGRDELQPDAGGTPSLSDAGSNDGVTKDGGAKDGGATDGGATDGGSGQTDGGSAVGGTDDGGTVCPLPAKLKWSSTGPLAAPSSPAGHDFVSLKDFTVVRWNGRYVVYATVFDARTNGWNMVNLNFGDWSEMDTAPQYDMANSPTRGGVAPTLFYFSPKKLWVLAYQWGFTYATSTDPTQPSKWSSGKPLLNGGPEGAIDQTVICDTANCFLFFGGDNGKIYKSKMPIGEFPSTFNGYTTVMSDTPANLFEAVQVYTVKGTPVRYLMVVEAMGAGGRFFRSFTASDLDGEWSPLAATETNPFAGKANVTFADGDAWTNDISHGDLVRENPSETQTIDPCHLQFLYQGFDKKKPVTYVLLPYRPALLTYTP